MNISGIIKDDIANGTGIRLSLFVSGCTHHCDGCFNSQTWDFNFGKPYTSEIQDEILDYLKKSYVTGLTILGGEPFEIVNQDAVWPLIREIKEKLPEKDIWMYSGYLYEELTDVNNKRCHGKFTDDILHNIDILVDGEFKIDLKDVRLNFRGSSNQRIIDVKETLKNNQIILSKLNN